MAAPAPYVDARDGEWPVPPHPVHHERDVVHLRSGGQRRHAGDPDRPIRVEHVDGLLGAQTLRGIRLDVCAVGGLGWGRRAGVGASAGQGDDESGCRCDRSRSPSHPATLPKRPRTFDHSRVAPLLPLAKDAQVVTLPTAERPTRPRTPTGRRPWRRGLPAGLRAPRPRGRWPRPGTPPRIPIG